MEITEIPFPFPGRIYRSAMPYSSYDAGGDLIPTYKRNDVSLIVVLTSDDEISRITGRDLRATYNNEGFEVLYLPVPDFGIPDMDEFRVSVDKVLSLSKAGEGTAIHCHAGLGRTGMFVACMVMIGMEYSADEAIAWVRNVIPGAVEVPSQEEFVRSF
jgi:protein-tyrosine phosphatase